MGHDAYLLGLLCRVHKLLLCHADTNNMFIHWEKKIRHVGMQHQRFRHANGR